MEANYAMTPNIHNTFDIKVPTKDNELYVASSHNFPGVEGTGPTETEAVRAMDRRIIYLRDNHPAQLDKWIKERRARDVTCLCGFKAEGDTGAIYWSK